MAIIKKWTKSAIECYQRGCICDGCEINEFMTSQKCRMKYSVLELVRILGAPQKNFGNIPNLSKSENDILFAIKDGASTLEDVAYYAKMQTVSVKQALNKHIYSIFENLGFIRPKYNAFPDFVTFIQNTKIDFKVVPKEEEKENEMFDEDLKLSCPDFCQSLISAVKKGYESYDDLERESGLSKHQISVYWTHILDAFYKKGLLEITEKTKKQQVIDFVRNRLIDVQNGNYKEELSKNLKGKIKIKPKQKTQQFDVSEEKTQEPMQAELTETSDNNPLEEELNKTKLLLADKNNKYVTRLEDISRLQLENEQLLKLCEKLQNNPVKVLKGYDEFMLIDDIREILNAEENDKIKIVTIKNYFKVYERFVS